LGKAYTYLRRGIVMRFLQILFLYGVVEAFAQESGVFGFGPASDGVLLKLDMKLGNSTVLSSQPANNSLIATQAARIHPTFKYWYQVFTDPTNHSSVRVEGREIFPGATLTSTTVLPQPSICSPGAENWVLFDLECGGRPVFVLGASSKNQLYLALVQINGTVKCLPPVNLADSFSSTWLQSALDLDSILYLTLNTSVTVLDISGAHPVVVAETTFPKPMVLSRLHFFFRMAALYGFYSISGAVGMISFNATSFQFEVFPVLSDCRLPAIPFLSTLDTDNALLIGVLSCQESLQYVAVDVSSGLMASSVPAKPGVVSLDALANVFSP